MSIAICGFLEARQRWPMFDSVISIVNFDVSEGGDIDRPHLTLSFDDIDFDDAAPYAPKAHHIESALEFADRHSSGNLLIHCRSGRCRSTAVALAVIAGRLGAQRETEAVNELLRIRPIALPNLIALSLEDSVLGRAGLLRNAWLAHEASSTEYADIRHRRYVYETTRHYRKRVDT